MPGTPRPITPMFAFRTHGIRRRALALLAAAALTACDTSGPLVSAVIKSDTDGLSALVLSAGALSPTFKSTTLNYAVDVANTVSTTTVTPTASVAGNTIAVNGGQVVSGQTTSDIPLQVGSNVIAITVTNILGSVRTYSVTVTRAQ